MNRETPSGRELRANPRQACTQRPAADRARRDLQSFSRPSPVPASGGRRPQSDCCLASAESGTMKLLPSVVLKLFLAAVLPALVTGESLSGFERPGCWNQQSGHPYSIYGPAAARGRWPRPGSPGLGRGKPGPFQSCFLLQATSSGHTKQGGAWEKKEERQGVREEEKPMSSEIQGLLHPRRMQIREGAPGSNLHLPPRLSRREVPWAEPPGEKSLIYVRSHNHPGCGGCGAIIRLSAGHHGASHVLVPQKRRL